MKYESLMLHPPLSIKDKLKPVVCESCKADDYVVGQCPECLASQAYNIEWLETHTFIYDDELRCYHDGDHNTIKCLPLRLPDEKPHLYYGFENEIEFDSTVRETEYYDEDDDGSEQYTAAYIEDTLAEASKILDGMAIYEMDSSLENGVEFIFRPMSYAYLTHKDTVNKLKRFYEYLRERGAWVKQPERNGMHVHLSRKFFEHGQIQNASKAYENLEWIFQYFQPEMEKLGRRAYTEYCESKADKFKRVMRSEMTTSYGRCKNLICTIEKGGTCLAYDDHHSAVNSDSKTIEVRVFKATSDYKTMLATAEIVRNIAHAVRDEDIKKSLDEILHTKDNLYLDEYIQKIKMECAKNKDPLTLDRVNTDEMDIEIEQ